MRTLFALVLGLVSAIYANGGAAAPTEPQPIDYRLPTWPAELPNTHAGGQVILEVLVNADGTVADVRVKSADHPAFANAAVAAVQSWCFQPVFRDAVPIASRAAIPFHFESPFDQRLNAVFKRKVYRSLPQPALSLQEFGSEPKPDKKIEPVYPKELMRSGLSGHVRIEFVIAPDGSTLNPRIQGKPWKGFVPAAIAAVAAATYEPPVKEGKGVYVAMIKTVRLVPPRINRERVGLRPYPSRRRYRFFGTGWVRAKLHGLVIFETMRVTRKSSIGNFRSP